MKNLSKLGIIDRVGEVAIGDDFAQGLMSYVKNSPYRRDLKRASRMKTADERNVVFVKYAASLGVPDVEEMTSYIIANYPGYRPNFEQADHDEKNHVVAIEIVKDVPTITMRNIEDVPEGFKAMGSGLYKDKKENVWSLKKDAKGNLSLTRAAEEKPIVETSKTDVFKVAKEWKVGQEVVLKTGEAGHIVNFDKSGNAIVKIANQPKLRIVSSNLLSENEKAQDAIRDKSEGDLNEYYKHMITYKHSPDKDQTKFYQDLVADPKI